MSKIEWTGKTWNPTIGCTEVSRGCLNCYAAKMAYRLMHIPAMAEDYSGIAKKLPNGRIVFTGLVKELPERVQEPYNVKKPTTWFVNSMSDLFHPDVTFNFIYKVFEMMLNCPQHTFQILTKQPVNMATMLRNHVYFHLWRNYPDLYGKPLPNVWIGVSAEDQKRLQERVPPLLCTPAAVRFVSYEPAIGAIDFDRIDIGDDTIVNVLSGKVHSVGNELLTDTWQPERIDWVICGGESGNGKLIAPMHPDWARKVRDQCKSAGVAFFFKQWGAWYPFYDRDIDDSDWRNVPTESEKIMRLDITGQQGFHGERVIYFEKVGKDKARHLLDGKEYFNYPKQ